MRAKNKLSDKYFAYFYITLPFLLTTVQLVFTLNSLNQIRYEELAETVTSVYWFAHRSIFYGAYTNVGWYLSLLSIYKIFGFSLFTAKFYRLFLGLISLICLAAILKKNLGLKRSFIPLITIGLSPTLLYFNTLQAQFGIDLQYFPICFYLVDSLNFKKGEWSLIRQFITGSVIMIAWTSYPVFVYYLPVLFLNYFLKLRKNFKANAKQALKDGFVFLTGFIAPVLAVHFYIQNKNLLWYDPETHNGLFRGAGNLSFKGDIVKNITSLASDLINQGNSYYFEIKAAEFSYLFPLLVVATVVLVNLYLLRFKKYRPFLAFGGLLTLLNLVAGNFTYDPSGLPGIRRYTVLLAFFYFLFIISWNFLIKERVFKWQLRKFLIAVCLLLPLHHLLVLPTNLPAISAPSKFAEKTWFNQAATPQESLDKMVAVVKERNLNLACIDKNSRPFDCRFSEVYAAVAGTCEWNHLSCNKIAVFNPSTNQLIPLSVDLWNNFYLKH